MSEQGPRPAAPAPKSRRVLGAAILLAAVWALPPLPLSAVDDGLPPAGEAFRSPILGERYEVRRAGRVKEFVSPRGEVFSSPREVFRHERSLFPPRSRVLAPSLAALAADPAAAADPVFVTILLARQPAHDVATEAREEIRAPLAAAFDEARAILDRIAAARPGPGETDLRGRMEAERTLLTAAERARLEALRAEVAEILAVYRARVRTEARTRAEIDQAPVRAFVEGPGGGVVVAANAILNCLCARLPAARLPDLVAARPEIVRVSPTGRSVALLDTSTVTIGAGSWWGAGLNGSLSTPVAVLDTGVDSSHPALSANVTSEGVFLDAALYETDFDDDENSTDDYDGHGTHIAGIVGSTDSTYPGVAGGTAVINGKCGFVTTSGDAGFLDPDIFDAADWAVGEGARVVNLSIGGPGADGTDDASYFCDALTSDLLVACAVAAGNEGPDSQTVGSPGDAFNIITTGYFDDWDTAAHTDNVLSSHSSRGPTTDFRRKPDLCAPGVYIMSCNTFWAKESDFVEMSGSSMATPHVAGACALLLDHMGSWRPEGLKALLLTTPINGGPYPSSPDDKWGYGGLDLSAAYAARASVRESSLTSGGPGAVFLRSGRLTAGKRVTLCWNRHITSNGSEVPDAPYYDLSDLDLAVYDEADGSAKGASESAVDPVEQVKVGATIENPVIKVLRSADSLAYGITTEDFAVAAEATTSTSVVTPPDLSCAILPLPASVRGGTVFDITVRVTNGGQLASQAGQLTLTLPAGFTIVSGSSPLALTRLAAGASTELVWTVRASSLPGNGTVSARAVSSSYGESFTSVLATAGLRVEAVPPEAPSGLTVTAFTTTTVSLSWTDSSDDESSFQLDRSVAGGAWATIATPGAGTTTHTDTGLAPATSLAYRVRARNPAGNSAFTAPATAVTAPTIDLTVLKGSLVDATTALKDKIGLAGRFAFNGASADGRLDPTADTLFIEVGTPGGALTVVIPAMSPGWKVKGAAMQWTSSKSSLPKVQLKLDAAKGTFALKVSAFSFKASQTSDIVVEIHAGGDGARDARTWSSKKPGTYTIP